MGDGDDDRLVLSLTDTGLLQYEADGNPATTDLGGGVELRVTAIPGAAPLITGLSIDLGDGDDEVVFARGALPFVFSSPVIELIVDATTETTRLETSQLTAPAALGDQLFQFGGPVIVPSETTIQAHNVEFVATLEGGQAADLDQDGDVDGHDALDLLMNLFSPPPDPQFLDGDLNDDGMVNLADLQFLIRFLGDETGLTVVADEGAAFAGNVGGVPLPRLVVEGDVELGAGGLDPPGMISIETTGEQTFAGAVTLLQDALLTSATGDVAFAGPIDGTTAGEQSLEINTPATTMFGGDVGGTVALEAIVTGPAPVVNPDDRTLIGGTVVTTGDQTYAEAVVLTGPTQLESDGAITFAATVDGGHDLAITAGTTTFQAAVGSTMPLASLTIDGTDGNTIFIAGPITTMGDQTYNDAVVLTADTTLTATNVLFEQTVDSDAVMPWDLEVNVSGTATFEGRVGSVEPLGGFSIGGQTTLDILVAPGESSVATTGDQTYDGPLVLVQDTNLFADMLSAITFAGTIAGSGAPLPSIIVNTSGTTTFNGAVSGLTNLTTSGSGVSGDVTVFNGGPITTIGAQAYEDAILLTDHTLLESDSVNFLSTVNSEAGEAWDLAITVDDLVTFNAQVGNLQELRDLEIVGVTEIGGPASISTTRHQLYDGAVMLLGETELMSALGDIAFLDSIHGTGVDLTVTATAGTVEFNGTVGETGPLSLLEVTGETQINIAMPPAVSIATSGGQIYHSPVLLLDDTVLQSNMDGDILFEDTVSGPGGLVVNTDGMTIFEGAVAGLASLTTDAGGQTDINGGSVSTTGDQTYNDPVILTADAVLTAANVLFSETVNSDAVQAWDLDINVSGTATFEGRVGDQQPLDMLTVSGQATLDIASPGMASVTSEGAQTYNGPVVLMQDTRLSSTAMGAITFTGSITGMGAPLPGLVVTTGGTTAFLGLVNSLASLTTDGGGTTDINGGTIITSGDQTYEDAVVLTAHTTLDGANITFQQTVDSETGENWDLNVLSSGTAEFNGQVGNAEPLRDLEVSDAIVLDIATAPSISTTRDQSFDGSVTLMQDTELSSASGDIAFLDTIDAVGGDHDLIVTAANGTVELNGAVGDAGPLGVLEVTGEAHISIAMPPALSITTNGGQTYHSPVVLLEDTALQSNMDGDVTFESTISGPGGLVVNTAGNTIFLGAVSGLDSLTTDAGGQTDINGGIITTAGDQSYNDAVVLTADTLLTAANVLFEQTVDSDAVMPWDLEINVGGNATFEGRVGDQEPLNALIVHGETIFDIASPGMPSVTTAGDQTYDGPVNLMEDTVLLSVGMATITFESTVAGTVLPLPNLTVTTGGTTSFNGAVGILLNLTTDGGGTTVINGGSIETTEDQTYNDDVLLTAHTTLTAANVTFDGTINSGAGTNRDLEIAAGGIVSFGGLVGNDDPLRRLIVTAGGAITLLNANAADPGPDIHTTDEISLQSDAVVQVQSSVVMTSDLGDITLDAGTNVDIQADAAIRAHGDITIRAGANIVVGLGAEILAGTEPPPPDLPLPELTFVVDADNMGGGTFTATGTTGLLGAPGGVFFLGGDDADVFTNQAERLRLGDDHQVSAGGGADTIDWIFAEETNVALDPGTTYVLQGGAGDDAISLTFGENVVVSTAAGTTLTVDGGAGDDDMTFDHSADAVPPPAPGMPAETARLVIFQYATADGTNVHVGGFGTANPDLNPAALPPTFVINNMETYELEGSAARDHLQVRGVQSPADNAIAVANAGAGVGDVSVTVPQYTRVKPAPQTVIPAQVVAVPRRFLVDGYDCMHLVGGSGNDTIINETGIEMGTTALTALIEGDGGNDILFGGNGLDVIFAGPGVDVLHGRGGEDYLFADLSLAFGGTPDDPIPVPVPGVPLFPDPPNLDPADRIYGGEGLNHLAQSGLDLAVGITGMLLDGGATKDVVGWLRAQIMPLSGTNLQMLLDSAFFGSTGKTGLIGTGCLVSDFAVSAFPDEMPEDPQAEEPVEEALAASAQPAVPQPLVSRDIGHQRETTVLLDSVAYQPLLDALFSDLAWLGHAR